jgi:hypothetical protein
MKKITLFYNEDAVSLKGYRLDTHTWTKGMENVRVIRVGDEVYKLVECLSAMTGNEGLKDATGKDMTK